MRILCLIIFLAVHVSAQTPTPVPSPTAAPKTATNASPTPMDIIKSYTTELRSVVEIKDASAQGKKNKIRENSIASKVRQFFDFDELAKQSLGTNWAKQKAADRKKFSKLFITLVESSYLAKSRSLVSDYDVTYLGETIKGTKANVTSRISRKDANVDIVYDLHKKSNKWMIYNITLDNVNLVRNYQSQFTQIIKQKGFAHLIKTMQARVEKPQEDVQL